MKTTPIAAMLTAALLAATAPVAVHAQKAAEMPLAVTTDSDGAPDRPGFGPDSVAPGLGLAAHLAATQIYLGLTEAQQAPWRDYCQALIAYLEPPAAAPDAAPGDTGQPLAAERMAQATLARADTAQRLLQAATALRGALDPAQVERLAQVQPGLGDGPHGRRGGERPHHARPAPAHDQAR